jgi:hypothetical protein
MRNFIEVKKNPLIGDNALVVCILFGIFFSVLVLKIGTDKHLSLDGVNYFFMVLEAQDFSKVAWSRQFAEFVNQWLLVLSVRWGGTNIPTLTKIFGISIALPYAISFLLCYWARRGEDKSDLFFPLLSLASISTVGDYDLACEHHVMMNVAWPIYFLLTSREKLLWLNGLVLCSLLVLFLRLYETAIFPGCLFFLICTIKAYRTKENKEKFVLIISMILLTIAIVIAIYYIIVPRSPTNKGSFVDSMQLVLRTKEILAFGAFFALLWLGWMTNRFRRRLKITFFCLSILPVIWYIGVRTNTDYAINANLSFGSRTLSAWLFPGVLLAALLVKITKGKINNFGITASSIFIVVMVCVNLLDNRYWSEFRQETRRIVRSEQGFVEIEKTSLWSDPYKDYRWDWNNSQLGLIWSYPCVNAILLNPKNVGWQPFNPLTERPLQKYLQYGSNFLDREEGARECEKS